MKSNTILEKEDLSEFNIRKSPFYEKEVEKGRKNLTRRKSRSSQLGSQLDPSSNRHSVKYEDDYRVEIDEIHTGAFGTLREENHKLTSYFKNKDVNSYDINV